MTSTFHPTSALTNLNIIRNEVAALPFLRDPPLHPACPTPFKIRVSPPLFFVTPTFKLFQTVPPPHATPSSPNSTHQPSLQLINGFKQISKGWFYQFNCHFLIFDILNPFTNISGFLNLWVIFRFIFRQLRMIFFIKSWRQKKTIFLQMHNTILQRVISKCKNEKPWKN